MKMLSFWMLLLVAFPLLLFSQEQQYAKLRVYLDGRPMEALQALGLACDHGKHRHKFYFESDFSEREQRLLTDNGFRYDVLIPDVVQYYQQQNAAPSDYRNSNCVPLTPTVYAPPVNFNLGSMGGYLTYQELLEQLDSMAQLYPHLISPRKAIDSTNLTHENRPIYWVRISDNPTVDENEPEALYTALHHAREPLSLSQLVYYMWYLLENYATNPEVQYIVNHAELYFVPCVNPDGYVYNENIQPNGGGMWRKNRRNNGDGTYGVDLNRNYAYAFAHNNTGSSGTTLDESYRGTAAFSEPETQNIRDFCLAHDFQFSINYHTYGDALIYPWAYNSQLTPDSTAFKAYVQVMTRDNGYAHGSNMETLGLNSNGDADDWLYGEQNLKNKTLALTAEVSSNSFWPPSTTILEHCQETMWQNLAMAHLMLLYGEVKNLSSRVMTQTNAYAHFKLNRYGAMSGNLEVDVVPLTTNIQSVGASKSFNLAALGEVEDSIALQLNPMIGNGEVVRYLLTLNNGSYTRSDTIERVYGNYALVLNDDGNTMTNWTNQGANSNWETTGATFYSPSSCITDSKTGNYPANTTTEILLQQALDLTGATDANVEFWAKWSIENDYDYVQVLAGRSNGIYEPLCGRYTNSGTNHQDENEPLYDGLQQTWVAEQLSLEDYLGDSAVRLKIRLVSDIWVTDDGFYFDDFKVNVLTPNVSSTQLLENENALLGQNQPNPARLKVYIPFNLSSAINEPLTLRIVDVLGRNVWESVVQAGQLGIEVEVDNWTEGVYTYQLLGGNYQSKPLKMVVVK